MSTSPHAAPDEPGIGQQHPLLADRPRLDKITKNMHVTIQRSLFGTHLSAKREQILGDGVSADDVLQQAVLALLSHAELPTTSWEALSVTIARNKAVDAVRHAAAGRRVGAADGDPDTITVVSMDKLVDSLTGLPDQSVWSNPERVFEHRSSSGT